MARTSLPGRTVVVASPQGTGESHLSNVVRADPVETWTEPKRTGGRRVMAGLSVRDAERWSGVADRLVGLIERALGPEVLATRSASPSRWAPEPVGTALRRARTPLARVARDAPIVVRTDVSDFYGSVTPTVLHGSLRRLGAGRADAALAAGLVEGWGSEGVRGLPIGPTPSALLANAVLSPVDAALRPWPFVRWVDDLLVAARSEARAAEILDRVDAALERLGLRRSESKTAVIDGGSVRWLGMSMGPPAAAAGRGSRPSPRP